MATTTRLAKYRTLAREERVATAIHEAGHAAVIWAFRSRTLLGIALSQEKDLCRSLLDDSILVAGGITFVTFEDFLSSYSSDSFAPETHTQIQMFKMVYYMGGPCAEQRLGESRNETDDYEWLDAIRDMYEPDLEPQHGTDGGFIFRAAKALYPDNESKLNGAVRRAGLLTHQLFSQSEMEASVMFVAGQMLKSKETYFAWDQIFGWMEQAWGKGPRPIDTPIWRRRFSQLRKLHAFNL